MTELQEREYEELDEILSGISAMYVELEDREVSESVAQTLDKTLYVLFETETAIRGRMNELNEDYCVRDARYSSNIRIYSQRLAELAKRAGINYVAIDRVNYHDREDAMRFIEKNGLASLNYEATCAAVEKFKEIRDREYWEKYLSAQDINTQALMLKVPYADLDAVIEYLRARGFAWHDMPSTCAGIEEYYALKRTA